MNKEAKKSKPLLVILGTRTDPHVDNVAAEMLARGVNDVAVLDYHSNVQLSLESTENGRVTIYVNDSPLPENYIVWDRTKIQPGTELYIRGDEISSGYAAQEWRAFYKLICGLSPGRVFNSLEARTCLVKPYQQMIAAKAGFLTPKTLITTNKLNVLRFQNESEGQLIMKSISAGKVKPAGEGELIPYNVMTMRLSSDDVAQADAKEIAFCPHFFQREIVKDYELRVVVVDECILAFRINSQSRKLTEVDWRKGLEYLEYVPHSLDEETNKKILCFMKGMGLFTGSIDLIIDPLGQAWFLECNQDGAWGWLDDVVKGKITHAFVDGFSRRLREFADRQSHVGLAKHASSSVSYNEHLDSFTKSDIA